VILLNTIKELNPEIAELIGAHIGDGSMELYKGRYVVSFFGHPIEDENYVKRIAEIYSKYFGVSPRIRKWSGVIGFQICSKDIFDFISSLGIPSGKKDGVDIPELIKLSDKEIVSSCIRGIFDTDGTMYFEFKNRKYYPRIQLKITSEKVAKSVNILLNERFDIKSTLYFRKESPNRKMSYFVEIRGVEKLERWMEEIGFNNIKHLSKVELWKDNINPRQQFDIRIKLLKGPVAQHGRAAHKTAEAFNLL